MLNFYVSKKRLSNFNFRVFKRRYPTVITIFCTMYHSSHYQFSRTHSGSLGFNIAEEDEETEEVVEEAEKDDINIGTVTMLSRQRLRSYSPTRIRELARNVSKTMRKKVRSSTVNIPGPSEGVLPPDARPVTAYEALHHLAKRVRRLEGRKEVHVCNFESSSWFL